MADMELRTNSVRLRFDRGDPEPTDADIFSFMKDKMALKGDSLLSMYKEKNEMSVIIKFKKEEDAQRTILRLPSTMEFRYNKYQCANIKLSMANAIMRYIRLFNLPPEVDDMEIQKVISKYGKVIRLVREKYAEETGFPIWTSVRGVYVELKDDVEIPGTMIIRNLRARVFYEGLVNKCYQCGSADHMKAECPQRKTVNARLQTSGPSSYSDAVNGGGRWIKKREPTNTNGGAGGELQHDQLQFTSLPLTKSYQTMESTGQEKEPEPCEPNHLITLSQQQAMQNAKRCSDKQNEQTTTTSSELPCTPIAVTQEEGKIQHQDEIMMEQVMMSETPCVTTTGVHEQWNLKTKRGRKPVGKEKQTKESESEHSTTESDHRADNDRSDAGKGVVTRNRTKQQKRCKVSEASDAMDDPHLEKREELEK